MFDRFFGRRQGRKGGKGLGDGNKPGAGPTGFCVCASCGHKIVHQLYERCMHKNCPKCGSQMVRE